MQCVRNVLNVDFHVVKYKKIVQELQKEVSQLSADESVTTVTISILDYLHV